LPHVKLLVDEEQRVRIRAGSNLRAYWPSRERFTRDPFVTGDLGLIDTAGNLQILGRADRIIITGGEKVHPEQVETAAMGTGLATGARCEGQPDPDWGQRVELTVVPSSPDTTRDGLVDALRETLPAYALPKKVLFVEQIFTNSMGKPVK
jgi:O-succinylbenzoic acid--CoA ligase